MSCCQVVCTFVLYWVLCEYLKTYLPLLLPPFVSLPTPLTPWTPLHWCSKLHWLRVYKNVDKKRLNYMSCNTTDYFEQPHQLRLPLRPLHPLHLLHRPHLLLHLLLRLLLLWQQEIPTVKWQHCLRHLPILHLVNKPNNNNTWYNPWLLHWMKSSPMKTCNHC